MSIGLNFDSNFGGFLRPLQMVLEAIYSLSKNQFATAISWLQEATLFNNSSLSSDLLHSVLLIGIQTHNSKYLRQTNSTEQLTYKSTDNIDDDYQVPILNG